MTPAAQALEGLAELLEAEDIAATRDAGKFNPAPVGVLIGLPSAVGATLGARIFEVPILVVSGDPLNTIAAVDRLYALADAIADVVSADGYRPSSWSSSSRVEPIPAVEVVATVTVPLTEEE